MPVNTFETRPRESFTPQRPHRAPWLAICLFAATVSFVAGSLVSQRPPSTPSRGGLIAAPGISIPTHKGFDPFMHSANPVADVAANAAPSVVSIDTVIVEKENPGSDLPGLLFPKKGGTSPFRLPDDIEAHGSGSGIIVRPDGYIMTNFHVVKGASNIKVTLNDGRVLPAHVIGHDGYTDVAVLKVDAGNLPVARLGQSKDIRPGDWAIAIGTPLGLKHTVTMGIISAVGRSLADLNNNVDLIQTDAPINPGNSGGPLLNIDGQVVGINMAIRTDAQNIGFSIPIDIARDAANAILARHPLLHPYLGVSMIDVDPELASSIGIPKKLQGVIVSRVNDKSPAAASGIAAGDVIESVDHQAVHTGSEVQKIVRQHKVGNKLDVQVVHAGKNKDVDVTLAPYPDNVDDDS